jgi:hypothetical protein
MDPNQHIESLQQKYTEALLSGNAENEQKIREEIDQFLEKGEIPNTSLEDSPPVVGEETEQTPTSSEPSAEVAVKDDTSTQAEPNKTETQNWLDSLDPAIRGNIEQLIQQNQQLEHQYKSVNGRLAAYQRRYEDAQKEAVKYKQQLTAPPQGQSAAASKNSPSLNKIEEDPDLKQLAETDEQLARVILKREEALRQEIESMKNALNENLSPLRQQFQHQQQQYELQKLTQIVPNAIEIFQHRAWQEWVDAQPPAVQALANSDYAEDAARAIELYGMDMRRIYGEPTRQTQQPARTNPDPRVEDVRKERERKLQAQPVGSPASARPPQRSTPTLEEIMANPDLLEKEQHRIYQETLKKSGRL